MTSLKSTILWAVVGSLVVGRSAHSAGRPGADSPSLAPNAAVQLGVEHNVGGFTVGNTNDGVYADSYLASLDYFTGQPINGCQYPIGSTTRYSFAGGLWIGGVAGTDTLVSTSYDGWMTGNEFQPVAGNSTIEYRSTISARADQRQGARSHQDFTVWFADTCSDCRSIPRNEPRYHIPLGMMVRQTSYAWSSLHARDIVIYVLDIFHVGTRPISNGYIGIFFDNDVYAVSPTINGADDDLTGFRQFHPGLTGCGIDTIPLAWLADNDGDFVSNPQFGGVMVPNVTATVPLDFSDVGPFNAYDWWVSDAYAGRDYGPRTISQPGDPYRQFANGAQGTPGLDVDRYYVMRHHEIDFDQAFVANVNPGDSIWAYPGDTVPIDNYADGFDARYFVSCGPFNLNPGDSVHFAWAFVGGRAFHIDSTNLANLPDDPWTYTDKLNFDDLVASARMATWVYDNPGVDTDSDGYAGKSRICGGDTVWYAGDGVPDLVADVPPMPPTVTVNPAESSFVVRWNGFESETSLDRVSREADFEGYHVYWRADSSDSASVHSAGYDAEDFFKCFWDTRQKAWQWDRFVYDPVQLETQYAPNGANDPLWEPQQFTRQHPLILDDSLIYFAPIGCNASQFGTQTPIVKRFPDALRPIYLQPSDVPAESTAVYLNERGEFKYYDYELTIQDVVPGQQYLVAVTAFDRGSPLGDRTMLESPITLIPVVANASQTCCVGSTGNVDCDAAESCDIGDLTRLIDYLFLCGPSLCCAEAANADGSADGNIDMADLTALLHALFFEGGRSTCR